MKIWLMVFLRAVPLQPIQQTTRSRDYEDMRRDRLNQRDEWENKKKIVETMKGLVIVLLDAGVEVFVYLNHCVTFYVMFCTSLYKK